MFDVDRPALAAETVVGTVRCCLQFWVWDPVAS